MTTEPMPIAEVSADLYARCLAFVQDQSSGEWGEFIEGEDSKKLVAFVVAETATALADAERKLVEATSILRAWDDWYCGRERELTPTDETSAFLAAQDGGKG